MIVNRLYNMKDEIKKIFFFFLTVLIFHNINAQEKYRAVNWGLDEGLSQGEVYAMIRDVNGFLWVATPFGLNRFDGSSFKKYYADKNKKKQNYHRK